MADIYAPNLEARRYVCPCEARHAGDAVGCGLHFTATPDDEGIVDCPGCGLWFTPSQEPVALSA